MTRAAGVPARRIVRRSDRMPCKRQVRVVVDHQVRAGDEPFPHVRNPVPVVIGERVLADALVVDPALGREDALDVLLLGHLQGARQDRQAEIEGRVDGHVHQGRCSCPCPAGAPTVTSWPGRKPEISSSRSAQPVVMPRLRVRALLDRLEGRVDQVGDAARLRRDARSPRPRRERGKRRRSGRPVRPHRRRPRSRSA